MEAMMRTKFPAYMLGYQIPCRRCGDHLAMPGGRPPLRVCDLEHAFCPTCRRRSRVRAVAIAVAILTAATTAQLIAWWPQ
jgi:hypothetical protein